MGGRHRHYTFTLAHLHTVFSSCRDREREWESDTGITLSHLHTCTLFLLSCRDREREWERDTDHRPSSSGRGGRGEWDPTPVRQ